MRRSAVKRPTEGEIRSADQGRDWDGAELSVRSGRAEGNVRPGEVR